MSRRSSAHRANPVVIANAANAAIQAGHIPIAADWVERAKGSMLDDPRLMRERERVLFTWVSMLSRRAWVTRC